MDLCWEKRFLNLDFNPSFKGKGIVDVLVMRLVRI